MKYNTSIISRIALAGFVAAGSCALRPAPAQAHQDIALCSGPQSDLLVGVGDHETGGYVFPVLVHEGGFDEAMFSNDPGFTAPEQPSGLPPGCSLLPADELISFAMNVFQLPGGIRSNFAYWDGEGAVSFAPVGSGHSLTVYGSLANQRVVNGADLVVPGFGFATTDDEGGIHEHLNFQLARSGGDVAEGIYLWEMQLSMPGLTASDPFFIVHETANAPLTLDLAVAWVDANYDALIGVPEPSIATIMGFGALLMLAIQCRRRKDQPRLRKPAH